MKNVKEFTVKELIDEALKIDGNHYVAQLIQRLAVELALRYNEKEDRYK